MNNAPPQSPDAPAPALAPLPASRIVGMRPYTTPPPDPSIDLFLNAAEGPLDIRRDDLAPDNAATCRRYPDATRLQRAIAGLHDVDPQRIVVTNGADDAIDRLARATLEPGRSCLIHDPTFEMIERSARLAGASIDRLRWLDDPFPATSFISMITDATALVATVTPNNPTGRCIPTPDLLRIADAAAARRATTLVDLAYAEFAENDPTRELLQRPNIVVLRTFSKAFALAGIRVGYAIAPPTIADWLRTTGSPFPVATPSLAIAEQALTNTSALRPAIERIREERTQLTNLFRELGADPFQSQSNFVLARVADPEALARRLARAAIAIRTFPARPALNNHVRISLPGEASAFQRLANALRANADVIAAPANNQKDGAQR